MSGRDYQLMIMDAAGGSVRRVHISRRCIVATLVGFVGVVFGSGAVAIHLLILSAQATESQRIIQENAELNTVLSRANSELPHVQQTALRSEISFRQVWAKSGLGLEPSLLAAGPLERDSNSFATMPAEQPQTGDSFDLDTRLKRVTTHAQGTRKTLNGLLDYFNDAEQMLSNTPSVRPASSSYLSSGFGKRRDPIDGRLMMHKGVDMAGPMGSDIVAPADGVVIFAGSRGGYGRTLVLDHGYGYQTHFAHLSGFEASVGDRVRRGQVIAHMGSTGKSTGPHLHYEVRHYGRPLDPARFMLD